jgi:hypothetical protein
MKVAVLDSLSIIRNSTVELFQLTAADVTDRYLGWLRDPRVIRYMESRFIEQDRAQLQRYVDAALKDPNVLLLGIRSEVAGWQHTGKLRINLNPCHRTAEVGVLIGERYLWGKVPQRRQ